MRKLFAIIVCFSLCAVMATAQGGKDAPKVEGTWTATSAISDGKKIPDDVIAKVMMVVTVKEGKYNVTVNGMKQEAGTYSIDAKKKPAQIDLTCTEGRDKGITQLGLLKIEGDVMTLATAKTGSKDRPKDFEGTEGFEVTVLKRGK